MKKSLLVVLIIIIISFMNYLIGRSNDRKTDLDYTYYRFIERIGKEIENHYGLRPSSVGIGAFDGTIDFMSLDFQRFKGKISQEEARRLIIAVLHDFLESANNDEKLRPFLKFYPFNVENTEIAVFNYEKDGRDIYDPYIYLVQAYKGKIRYYSKNISNGNRTDFEKNNETYEEALAILNKEKANENEN